MSERHETTDVAYLGLDAALREAKRELAEVTAQRDEAREALSHPSAQGEAEAMRKLLTELDALKGVPWLVEAMHLQHRWIGRDGIKLISTGEERTKSGEWREIPRTKGADEALEALKAARVEGGYVLPRMTLPSLSRAFVRDAKRADLGGSLHSLRHTYISHLVRDTEVPMRTVQLYAGHAHISTTEGYLYLRDTRTHVKVRELAL